MCGEVQRAAWGPDDQIGAANELDEQSTMRAVDLVRQGRVFDLSQAIGRDSPRLPDLMSPYSLCMWSNPEVSRRWIADHWGAVNGIGYADERVELDLHTGTHIDGLGHVCVGDEMYNGNSVQDVVGNWGLAKLGIEHLPPVVTRGVLIDVPRFRGRDLLAGEVISVDDLRGALDRQQVQLTRGDLVLVRTGWSRYYARDNQTYASAWPGIGRLAAEWLVEHRVVAVAGDTMGLEVYPDEIREIHAPVHQLLLARSGVYIIEQACFEELADAGTFEFLCLCLAPKFTGATAAPVRLAAIA